MVQIYAGDVALAALPRVADIDCRRSGVADGLHNKKDGGGKTGGGGKNSPWHDHADKIEGRYVHHERLGGGDGAGNRPMAHKIPAALSDWYRLQSKGRLHTKSYYYYKGDYTAGASTEEMVGDRSHSDGRGLPWRNYYEAKEVGF